VDEVKCKWCNGDENGPPKFRHDIGFTCGNDRHSGVFENATREELDSDLIDRAALAILQGYCSANPADNANMAMIWENAIRFVKARAEAVGKE
jgi:hypothetical protein